MGAIGERRDLADDDVGGAFAFVAARGRRPLGAPAERDGLAAAGVDGARPSAISRDETSPAAERPI